VLTHFVRLAGVRSFELQPQPACAHSKPELRHALSYKIPIIVDARISRTGPCVRQRHRRSDAQCGCLRQWVSRVEAAFVAEEGPTLLTPPRNYTPGEYNNVINYAIAHECGHLFFGLLDVPSGAGDLMNHASNPGSAGLGACGTSPTECSQLNLVGRNQPTDNERDQFDL